MVETVLSYNSIERDTGMQTFCYSLYARIHIFAQVTYLRSANFKMLHHFVILNYVIRDGRIVGNDIECENIIGNALHIFSKVLLKELLK